MQSFLVKHLPGFRGFFPWNCGGPWDIWLSLT